MAELIRKFTTNSGSVYSQVNQIGSNGKIIFKSWKRAFKNGHKITVKDIKEAVYLSLEDYNKARKEFKGKEKSRLVELARLGDYQGRGGVIWFLDKDSEIYTSSFVKVIDPPYNVQSSVKKETKKSYEGKGSTNISDNDIADILLDDKKEKPGAKKDELIDDDEFKIEA